MLLVSKNYEFYVLDWLREEVSLWTNQYRAMKGMGTEHVFTWLWQTILDNLEDYRADTVITSIDYLGALNKMSF